MLLLAAAAFAEPCATLRLLPDAPPVRTGQVRSIGGPRALRDAYHLPNHATSARFALHWGGDGLVPVATATELLAELELAWDVEVDQMGHEPPYGTDAFLFNVYVGDSGDGAPPSDNVGGYYTPDPEGWPMIVLADTTVATATYRASTAAHELYHALQNVRSRYAYEGSTAWYWEATAEWAALQVYPEDPIGGASLFGYLLLPALPINAYQRPYGWDIEEYHQYGAFLFPYDLTEQVGFELVRDTWLDEGRDPDPLEVMRAWLAERDLDLDRLWLDHIARATVFDYPHGDVWRSDVAQSERYWPDAHFLAASVEGSGTGEVKGDKAPRRYGTARIELRDPDDGVLTVVVEGEEEGSEGSDPVYGARLVRTRDDGTFRTEEVPFDGARGKLVLEVEPADVELHLVVSAWTPTLYAAVWDVERFPFAWSLQEQDPGTLGGDAAPEEDEPLPPSVSNPPDRSEACDTTGPGPAVAGWLSALASWSARRRRTAR